MTFSSPEHGNTVLFYISQFSDTEKSTGGRMKFYFIQLAVILSMMREHEVYSGKILSKKAP